MRRALASLCLLLTACAPAQRSTPARAAASAPSVAPAPDPGPTPERQALERLVVAISAHDPQAVRAAVTDDAILFTAEGEVMRADFRGGDVFASEMRSFFRSIPDVRVAIDEAVQAGPLIAVRQTMRWTSGADGRASTRASLVVYGLRDGRVHRMVHFNPEEGVPGGRPAVDRLIAAFNAHDADALRMTVTDDVVWFNVDGEALREDTRGGDALRDSMRKYFASVPDVRSTVESALEVGPYVALRERVRWRAKDGAERTATALALYEVREGRVRRAWYWPPGP